MKLDHVTITKYSVLCSSHFSSDSFHKSNVSLKPNTKPSLSPQFHDHEESIDLVETQAVAAYEEVAEEIISPLEHAGSDTETASSEDEERDCLESPKKKKIKNQVSNIDIPKLQYNEVIIDHNYATNKSSHEVNYKLKLEIKSLKRKAKVDKVTKSRLKKRVKSMTSLIESLKNKQFITSNCETLMCQSFSKFQVDLICFEGKPAIWLTL